MSQDAMIDSGVRAASRWRTNELLSRNLKSEPVHAERTHVSADISNNNNGTSCVENVEFDKDWMKKCETNCNVFILTQKVEEMTA